MADALSFTANVDAMISLGLTISQGLTVCCQPFAAQNEKLRAALQDLRDLSRSLAYLHGTVTLVASRWQYLFGFLLLHADRLKGRIDDLDSVLKDPKKDGSAHDSIKDKVKSDARSNLGTG